MSNNPVLHMDPDGTYDIAHPDYPDLEYNQGDYDGLLPGGTGSPSGAAGFSNDVGGSITDGGVPSFLRFHSWWKRVDMSDELDASVNYNYYYNEDGILTVGNFENAVPVKLKKVYFAHVISPMATRGNFFEGFADGFVAGGQSTVDFIESLGTAKGWKDLGTGLWNFASMGAFSDPEAIAQRQMAAMSTYAYVKNIPNMSGYEMGYDLGFGTEKAVEALITRNIYTGAGVGIGQIRLLSNTTMRGTTLFKTGRNFRIDLDWKKGLHYHRRGKRLPNGQTRPGQGIGRHKPWDNSMHDKNWYDRF